ncbi:Hypothetical predicted protein [Mytilus galloprovincialis]|uniref:C1q domain-containing protein n=1 Tax=Mytilus galloprovincialis TaxID=29158 RepID=A0A8B6CDJ6_MYTGA|nr:Hypothetical predicted protein [Mytilus galloprovincialis]
MTILMFGPWFIAHYKYVDHPTPIGNNTEESAIADLVKTVEDLENKLKNISDHLTKDQDVLYVTLSESMKDVSNEVTVIFDRPQINPGNHYNQNDGIYIAPFSGRIMAFWTIGTNETARTELMVEDRVVGTLMTAASSVTTNNRYGSSNTVRESSSSTVAVTDVQRGNHILLRTASHDNHILKTVSSLLIRRTL